MGQQIRFGAILFTEKEGFNDLWKAVQLQERYDIAIASTKGMTTVSFRALVDALTEQVPGLRIFALTDFDTTGVQIAHWVSASNERYDFDNEIDVERIGINLDQALALDRLGRSEPGAFTSKSMDETLAPICSEEEIDFLVTRKMRVELNALTSGELVDLVETAFEGLERVVPRDDSVLQEAWYEASIRARLQTKEDDLRRKPFEAADADHIRSVIEEGMAATPAISWDGVICRSVMRCRYVARVGSSARHTVE